MQDSAPSHHANVTQQFTTYSNRMFMWPCLCLLFSIIALIPYHLFSKYTTYSVIYSRRQYYPCKRPAPVACPTLKLFFKFTSYFGCFLMCILFWASVWWMLIKRNAVRIAQVTSIVPLKLLTDSLRKYELNVYPILIVAVWCTAPISPFSMLYTDRVLYEVSPLQHWSHYRLA